MNDARRGLRAETAAWTEAYHSRPLVARRRATYRRKLRRLGLTGLPPGQAVLDIACGSGEFLDLLAAGGARPLVGIDPIRPPGRLGSYRRLAADGCHLPFADASFRHVLCTHSLHHFGSFDKVGQLLAEVRRVLAPGGRVYLVDHFGSAYLKLLYRAMAIPCGCFPPALRLLGAQLREEREYLDWWLANWRDLFRAVPRSGLRVARFRRGLFFFYMVCQRADG